MLSMSTEQFEKNSDSRKTAYFSSFAMKHLYPFRGFFGEGGILGRGEGNREWRNISEHCLVASVVADILAEHLGADRKVADAALLHDTGKRREVESKAAEGTDYWTETERDKQGMRRLLLETMKLDEDEAGKLVALSHANFPDRRWIEKNSDGSLAASPERTLEEKIIHLVDEIVAGTDIVPFRERIGTQAKKERGRAFYDSFRSHFGGVPLDEVHMALCEADEREFEKRLGIQEETLIDFLKKELQKRIDAHSA